MWSWGRTTIETALRCLEAFEGAGGTMVLPALAAGLRLFLFAMDRALIHG